VNNKVSAPIALESGTFSGSLKIIPVILLLLIAAACSPAVGQNSNSDGADLLSGQAAVLECADGQLDFFEPVVNLFSNREYVAKEVPVALRGFEFIRGNLEAVHAVCRQPGLVFVVTPTMGQNPDSRGEVLLAHGFQKTSLPECNLFGGGLCSVYQKQVESGEVLDFGKWVVLVLPGTGSKLLQPEGPVATAGLDSFVHPPVNFNPGPEYGPARRNYQGIPGIERAPGGRLWAVWYAGKVWEDQYNYVVGATSGDDGKTWSDLKFVIDPDGDGPMRTSDPCFWLDPNGRLWLFWWLNGPGELATVTMAMTTDNPDDESPRWSAPRVICKGVMLNKPIVTRDGAWIFPTAIWHTDGSCRTMVSTDKGKSWVLQGKANVPPDQRDCDEPMIVERRDGSLWQLARTKFGIAQSVSKDGGSTWTEFENCLPDATSRFFLRRLASGNLLLVKHGPLDKKINRSHLTAYLSGDDGATWKGGLVLDERDSVSYPDGTQAPDGTIRVIYDWNRGRDKHILMAVFTEADVLAGKFTSAAARSRVLINQASGINPKIYPNGMPDPQSGNPPQSPSAVRKK